jgi:hypothetical protein
MTLGRPERGDETHARAVERLENAIDQQAELRDAAADARGTSDEDDADDKLQEAGARVAARDAWLTWVERGF